MKIEFKIVWILHSSNSGPLLIMFRVRSIAQRWTLIATKVHAIFGTHHKQMDCFWNASSLDTIAWIQYCAISTVVNDCKIVYTRTCECSNKFDCLTNKVSLHKLLAFICWHKRYLHLCQCSYSSWYSHSVQSLPFIDITRCQDIII